MSDILKNDKNLQQISEEELDEVIGGGGFAFHQSCKGCGHTFGSSAPAQYCPTCKKKLAVAKQQLKQTDSKIMLA